MSEAALTLVAEPLRGQTLKEVLEGDPGGGVLLPGGASGTSTTSEAR